MAITGLAPKEKAEHMIYTILPVSVGLWFATIGIALAVIALIGFAIFGINKLRKPTIEEKEDTKEEES